MKKKKKQCTIDYVCIYEDYIAAKVKQKMAGFTNKEIFKLIFQQLLSINALSNKSHLGTIFMVPCTEIWSEQEIMTCGREYEDASSHGAPNF